MNKIDILLVFMDPETKGRCVVHVDGKHKVCQYLQTL